MRVSTMTRPDISDAVRVVARHSNNLTDRHWKSIIMAVSYLHGVWGWGSGLELTACSGDKYVDTSNNRLSVSEAVVLLGGTVVIWARNKSLVSPKNRGRGGGYVISIYIPQKNMTKS